MNDSLDLLEILVDELVKDRPEEPKVRSCMQAAGLAYVADPIARLNTVLECLEEIRAARRTGQSPVSRGPGHSKEEEPEL